MNTVADAEGAPLGRILFVTSNFPRWVGDSTTPFVLNLAQDLQGMGWRVHVLAPHAEGAARVEVLDGVSVERFRYLWPASAQTVCYQGGALLNLRRRPSNFAKLPALVASELAKTAQRLGGRRFSLVHSHWILPQGFTSGLAARVLGIPHVATVHGGDVFALRNPALAPFKRAALRLADAVTVNSSATLAAVCALHSCEGRIHRIPMGATVQLDGNPRRVGELRSRYRRGDGPMLVFVGRLIEEKGVADMISAIPDLLHYLPDITALIVGEGPDKGRFQAQAADLGIADRVQFSGWVEPSAVPDYLRAADIFVGPSKRSPEGWVEAQGLVYLEAMLAGIPVIACATGGVSDIVIDNATGLQVAESAPHEIVQAVLRIQRNEALRCQLTHNALALVGNEFSRQASARRFSELYATLLAGR